MPLDRAGSPGEFPRGQPLDWDGDYKIRIGSKGDVRRAYSVRSRAIRLTVEDCVLCVCHTAFRFLHQYDICARMPPEILVSSARAKIRSERLDITPGRGIRAALWCPEVR